MKNPAAAILLPHIKKQEFPTDKEGNPVPGRFGFDGKVFKPYDSLEGGTKTIAWGRKLSIEDDPEMEWTISQAEAALQEDLQRYLQRAQEYVDGRYGNGTFEKLPPRVQAVMGDLSYNAGISKFPATVASLVRGDYETAAQGIRQRYYTTPKGKKVYLTDRNEATVRLLFGEGADKPAPFEQPTFAVGQPRSQVERVRYKRRDGTFDPLMLPNVPFYPIGKQRDPDFILDLVPRAFRRENVVASLWSHMRDYATPMETGFDPFDPQLNAGTVYETNPSYLVGVHSRTEWERKKLAIEREIDDLQTLYHRGGAWGWTAGMAAGFISPETLIPIGLPLRATTLLGRAGLYAATGAALQAGVEVGLQHNQVTRTGLESAFNISGAAVAVGVLGTAASKLSDASKARLARKIQDDIGRPSPPDGTSRQLLQDIQSLRDTQLQEPATWITEGSEADRLTFVLGKMKEGPIRGGSGEPPRLPPKRPRPDSEFVYSNRPPDAPADSPEWGARVEYPTGEVEYWTPLPGGWSGTNPNDHTLFLLARDLGSRMDDARVKIELGTMVEGRFHLEHANGREYLQQALAEASRIADIEKQPPIGREAAPPVEDLPERSILDPLDEASADQYLDLVDRINRGEATVTEAVEEMAKLEESIRTLRESLPTTPYGDLVQETIDQATNFLQTLREYAGVEARPENVHDFKNVLRHKQQMNATIAQINRQKKHIAKLLTEQAQLEAEVASSKVTPLGKAKDLRVRQELVERAMADLQELENNLGYDIAALHAAVEDAARVVPAPTPDELLAKYPNATLRDLDIWRRAYSNQPLPEPEFKLLWEVANLRLMVGGDTPSDIVALFKRSVNSLGTIEDNSVQRFWAQSFLNLMDEMPKVDGKPQIATKEWQDLHAILVEMTKPWEPPPTTPRGGRGPRRTPSYHKSSDGVLYIHRKVDPESTKAYQGGYYSDLGAVAGGAGKKSQGPKGVAGGEPPGSQPPKLPEAPAEPPTRPTPPNGPPPPDLSLEAIEAAVNSYGVAEVLAKIGVSPTFRLAIRSPFIRSRQIVQQLVNTHIRWVKNDLFIPTPVSAESKIYAHHALVNWVTDKFDEAWAAYAARVAGERMQGSTRGGISSLKQLKFRAEQKFLGLHKDVMTPLQADEAVGRYIRYGTTTGAQELDDYGKALQKLLAHYRDQAEEVGLFGHGGDAEKNLRYLTRLWNRREILRQKGQANSLAHRIGDWLLEEELKRVEDILAASPESDVQPRFGREEALRMGVDIEEAILHTPDGRSFPAEFPFQKGRPLRSRGLDFDDSLISDFLYHDARRIMRYYIRHVSPDIEIARKFRIPDNIKSAWALDPETWLPRVVHKEEALKFEVAQELMDETLDLSQIPGVGKAKAAKIEEWLSKRLVDTKTGEVREASVFDLVDELEKAGGKVPGLGPKGNQAVSDFAQQRFQALMDLASGKLPGKPDLELQGPLAALQREFEDRMSFTTSPMERQELYKNYASDRQDIINLRDRLRNLHYGGSDPTSVSSRIARSARRINYQIQGGGFVFSAVPDLGKLVHEHGIERVYHDLVLQLMRDAKKWKINNREAALAATAIDEASRRSRLGLLDIGEETLEVTKLEEMISTGADLMAHASWLPGWNDFAKRLANILTLQRIARIAEAGATASDKERAWAAKYGLGPKSIDLIAGQLAKFGTKDADGYWTVNSHLWDDATAQDLFRHALRTHVDQTIVTPGAGDRPFFWDNEFWRSIFQYKGFGMASMNQTLVSGLQQRDAAVIQGHLMAVFLGMAVYQLKAIQYNFPTSNDPREWIKQGVDRSGMWGTLADANNILSSSTMGSLSLGRIMGGPNTQFYGDRRLISGILGPTYSTLSDLQKVVEVAPRVISDGIGQARADEIHSFRKLMAYNTVWYLDFLYDRLERGLKKSARENRKAIE